jgi:hypothetical protein
LIGVFDKTLLEQTESATNFSSLPSTILSTTLAGLPVTWAL